MRAGAGRSRATRWRSRIPAIRGPATAVRGPRRSPEADSSRRRTGITVRDLTDSSRLVYVTPSHQFPTGVSMSLARRLELIEWARRDGAVIIEDDYDSEYRYNGPPLPAMQSLANGVPVIYVGTFSNVMFPGLRIGYVVVPPRWSAPFTRAKWLADRHTTCSSRRRSRTSSG